jgi:sulfate transport system substrate-binding protein
MPIRKLQRWALELPGCTGFALKQPGGNDAAALEFVKKLFGNVKTLETGTHSSITTFIERGIGDVLLVWENKAHLIVKEQGGDKLSDVLVRNGTREVAQAYIDYFTHRRHRK